MHIKDAIKELLEGKGLDDALKDLLEADTKLKDLYRKWLSTDTDEDYFSFLRAWLQSGEELEPFNIDAKTRAAVDLKKMRAYLRQHHKHITVRIGKIPSDYSAPSIPFIFKMRAKKGKKGPEKLQYFHYPGAPHMRFLIRRMIRRPSTKWDILRRSKGYTLIPPRLTDYYGPEYQELYEVSKKLLKAVFSVRAF